MPLASRNAKVLAVAVLTPVVAEFATLPAVEIVANFVSTIAAVALTSALTINEVDKTPAALLCTTPVAFKAVTVAFALVTVLNAELPEASRDAIALAVAALVAVVAELLTLPAVAIVPSFVSAMAAAGSTSAFTIKLVDNTPDALLCTTPTVFNPVTVELALVSVLNAAFPDPSRNTNVLAVAVETPDVAEFATLPAVAIVASFVSTIAAVGSTSALTIKLLDTAPEVLLCNTPAVVKGEIVRDETVIGPIFNPPLPSRNAMVLAVAAVVAVVAELDTLPAVEMVASLVSTMAAAGSTSALTINDVVKAPAALLCTTPAVLNALKVTLLNVVLPEPSRDAIALMVAALVAVVAEFDTLPAVAIVASLVSTIAAAGSTSALTIKDDDKTPDALLCTTPAVPNPLNVTLLNAALPEPSRRAKVLGVAADTPDVAELATLPAVEMVASLVSTIPALAEMSALVTNEVEKLPDASVCTTPNAFKLNA